MPCWTDKTKAKTVSWNQITTTRKQYAVRDQPTWKNCKLQRPFETKADQKLFPGKVGREAQLKETEIRLITPLTQQSITPKFPCRSKSVASTSIVSNVSNSVTLQDLVENETQAAYIDRNEKGRDIIKRKAKELTKFRFCMKEDTSSLTKRKESRSFKRFRIASAESGHRSPDVSIGLRHISRMVQTFVEPESTHIRLTERRRSESLITSLTHVTSTNIYKTKRRSCSVVLPNTRSCNDTYPDTPAPGEGYLQQRRRSSMSAPATRGTESCSGSKKSKTQKTRQIPRGTDYSPYADREWRPTNLQRFSLHSPWAPAQQTGRYFPNYRNLQDMHCRNPFLVPGSILHKDRVLPD